MVRKQYTDTERTFVFEWADRWCQFVNLIYELLRSDRPTVPSIPTEIDEIGYQSLRFWFIDNKVPFLALWKDFCESQDWALDTSNDLIAEIRGAKQTLEPLLFDFYDFEDLNTLLRVCVIDNESDKMSEQKAWTSAMALLTLDTIAAEFVGWVCDRTSNSSA